MTCMNRRYRNGLQTKSAGGKAIKYALKQSNKHWLLLVSDSTEAINAFLPAKEHLYVIIFENKIVHVANVTADSMLHRNNSKTLLFKTRVNVL